MNSLRQAFLGSVFSAFALSALGQHAVQFDRARYDISPGETFPAQVRIAPVPGAALHSFGVRLSFSPSNAVVAGRNAIVVAAALDFDGPRGPGAVKALGSGLAASKGTVDFFASPMPAYPGQVLTEFLITDLAPGPYTLSLDFFNTLGPTEQIFVAGDGTVLDPHITFGTALVNYRPEVEFTHPADGAVLTNATSITLQLQARDLDGRVARVEVFEGATRLGTGTVPPFDFVWPVPSVGVHVLTAIATDNLGAVSLPAELNLIAVPAAASDFYVIFAGEALKPPKKKVIYWKGRGNVATGKVHSNSDIKVTGKDHVFRNGTVEYVTGIDPPKDFSKRATLINSVLTQSVVKPYPVDYELAEFAPGGPAAVLAAAEGQYFHLRPKKETDLRDYATNGILREGLYFVEGKIKLHDKITGGRVTLVATDEIHIHSHFATFQSYTDCLLAFSTLKTKDYKKHAIHIHGKNSKWQGIVFAPDGAIHISSSTKPDEWDEEGDKPDPVDYPDDEDALTENATLLGALIGRSVRVNGKNFRVTGLDPVLCTPLLSPLAPVRVGKNLLIVFPTVDGLTYVVEYTEHLHHPNWQPFATLVGDGGYQSLKVPTSTRHRFFRLRLQ